MLASSQPVTPELRKWIVDQTLAGCNPADVLGAMRESGWEEAVALAAMRPNERRSLKIKLGYRFFHFTA